MNANRIAHHTERAKSIRKQRMLWLLYHGRLLPMGSASMYEELTPRQAMNLEGCRWYLARKAERAARKAA